jgi:hypothetical protein
MPKLNICDQDYAMYGSCLDDGIHSQPLAENNSKSITYMNELVLEYSAVGWPKSQQYLSLRPESFLQF